MVIGGAGSVAAANKAISGSAFLLAEPHKTLIRDNLRPGTGPWQPVDNRLSSQKPYNTAVM